MHLFLIVYSMCGNCVLSIHMYFSCCKQKSLNTPRVQVAHFGRDGSVKVADLVFAISKKKKKNFLFEFSFPLLVFCECSFLCFAQGFGVHVAGKGTSFICLCFLLHQPRKTDIFHFRGGKDTILHCRCSFTLQNKFGL